MSLMIIRHSIPDSFQDSITAKIENAKKILAEIEKYFAKKKKKKQSSLFTSLTFIRNKSNGNIKRGKLLTLVGSEVNLASMPTAA